MKTPIISLSLSLVLSLLLLPARASARGGHSGGGHYSGGHSGGSFHGSSHQGGSHHIGGHGYHGYGLYGGGLYGLSRYGSYYGSRSYYGYRSAPYYRGRVVDDCAECALVAGVQRALARRGYYRGPIDAIFGGGSQRALRAFQSNARLPATGRIDARTLNKLGLG